MNTSRIHFGRCRCTSVFAMASVLFCIPPMHNARSDDSHPEIKLLIPSKIDNIRFGDPVLVPVAFANFGKTKVCVPSLSGPDPPLHLSVKTPNGSVVDWAYGQSMAEGRVHWLEPGEIEHTIFVVNLYSPDAVGESLLPQLINRYSCTFEFGPQKCFGTEIRAPARKHSINIDFAVSSFTGAGETALLKAVADQKKEDEGPFYGSNIVFGGHGSPYWETVTPLSWLTSGRAGRSEVATWFERESPILLKTRELVIANTRLDRMLRASLLLAEINRSGPPELNEKTDQLISDYCDVIERADPIEQQYLALLTKRIYLFQSSPYPREAWDWEYVNATKTRFASRFPHLAPAFLSERFSFTSKFIPDSADPVVEKEPAKTK